MERIKSVDVLATPLDSLVRELNLDRVDLIKVDAESSEYFVLCGLLETLKKFKPDIIVELGDVGVSGAEYTTKDVINLMVSNGYTCKTIDSSGASKTMETETEYKYCNVLFQYSST